MKLYVIIITHLILIVSSTRSEEDLPNYYNAAIVEFEPNTNLAISIEERLASTALDFVKTLDDIANPLDLIVFPESVLGYFSPVNERAATQVPPPHDVVLCNSTNKNYANFLKTISCAAIEYKTVIVVNVLENDDGVFYNTDVALGTNGTVLARYRKWNLFGELGKTKPKTPDLPVLDIKNTTFGMMTCFDILFAVPGFNLTREKRVKNVIFPTNWISELPYLTALQTQQMWAQEHDVTLLAAGASYPNAGAGGSGVYLGKYGALDMDIVAEGGTKVTYQSVPIIPEVGRSIRINQTVTTTNEIDALAKQMDDFFMLTDTSIADHASMVLEPNTQQATVCGGTSDDVICCEFNISASQDQYVTPQTAKMYTYHLVAYKGVRSFSGVYKGGVETCAVVACLNRTVNSCGKRFPDYSEVVWPITFHRISVSANFTKSDQKIQYPTSLLSSIRPIETSFTSWLKQEADDRVTRTYVLEKAQNRLLTFGIYGRDFSGDSDPVRSDSGTQWRRPWSYSVIIGLMLMVVFVTI